MAQIPSVAFNIKISLIGEPKIVITDTTPVIAGLLATFDVTQPDGYSRVGSDVTPDIPDAAASQTCEIPLRLASDGKAQSGAYRIVGRYKATGYDDTQLIRDFTLSIIIPDVSVRYNFDTFSPVLEAIDETPYGALGGWTITGSVSRAFTGSSNPTGVISTTGAILDLLFGGSYYDAVYSINLNSQVVYQSVNYAFLQFEADFISSRTVKTQAPPSYTQLVEDIEVLRMKAEYGPVGYRNTYRDSFNYAVGLLGDISNKLKSGYTSSIWDELISLLKILNNGVVPVYIPTNLPIVGFVVSGDQGITINGSTQYIGYNPSWVVGDVRSTRKLTINGVEYDLSADRSWSIASGNPVEQILTDGATTTMDISLGKWAKWTIGGNRTFVFSGLTSGDAGLIEIKQDATGGRTVTWPANADIPTDGLALSSGAGEKTIVGYAYIGGRIVLSKENYGVSAPGDITAPTVVSIRVENATPNRIDILYNETLNAAFVPAIGDFAVSGGKSVTGVAVVGLTVQVTVNSNYAFGASIGIGYTPGTNKIQDSAGNNAAAITYSGTNVTNAVSGSSSLPHTSAFTAANGTLLSAYTPTAGNAWVDAYGSGEIQSNKAVPLTFTSGEWQSFTDLGQNTYTITAVVAALVGGTPSAYLFFRRVNGANMMFITLDFGANLVKLWSVVAGVVTQVGSTVTPSPTIGDGFDHTFVLVVGASTCTLTIDGNVAFTGAAIDVAASGNNVGIGATGLGIAAGDVQYNSFNAVA